MFTGIIEDTGVIERIAGSPKGGKTLTVRTKIDPKTIAIGDSIAVNGVCLTATRIDGPRFTVDAGPETLARTSIGRLSAGDRVNLERALALGDRLGGHLVHGHVDGLGTLISATPHDNAHDVVIEGPAELAELVAPRGSVAIDGISLTVTTVENSAKGFRFGVMIIPHTWQVTTLSQRRVGDVVNLEADMLARYLARMLDARGITAPGKRRLTETDLREKGW